MRRLLLGLAVIARDLVGTLLVLALIFVGFLLFTQTGAVLALRVVQDATGLITVEAVEGRLWGSLRLQGLRYEDERTRVVVDRIAVEWSPLALLARQLRVDRLDVGEVVVTLGPSPEEESPPITQLPLDLLLDEARVQRLDLHLAEAEPLVIEAIELSADWRATRIALRRLAARTPWVGAIVLQGDAELQPEAMVFDGVRAKGFVQAQLQGRLGYTTPSDLKLRWTELHWPPQGETQLSSAHGELHWTGLFEAYRYDLKAQVRAAGLDAELGARGHGTLTQLTAESLVATLLGGRVLAHAAADWSGSLRLEAGGRVQDLNPALVLPEWPGRINGRFEARSRLDGEHPVIDFNASLQNSKLRGYPLALETQGRYAEDRVDLQRMTLSSGGSRLRASGRVYPQLGVEAQLDSPDLAALWPDLHGRAQLKAAVRGDYARPAIRAQGELSNLRHGDLGLQRATLNVDVDLATRLNLRLDAQQLTVGQDIRALSLVVEGAPAAHRITASAAMADGTVALAAQGRLDLDRPGWNGELTEARLAPLRLSAWTLEAPVPVALGPGIDLQTACWRSAEAARACVRVRVNGDTQRYALQLERFELASLAPLLPADRSLRGLLDGTATVALDARGLQTLQAQLSSGEGEWRQRGLPSLRWQPGHLRAEETPDGLVASAELPFAGGGLSAEARLAPGAVLMERALTGQARIEWPDLAFAQALSAELQAVKGRLDGAFDVAGTLAAPQLQGRVELSDGSLRLATPGIELRELSARVIAAGSEPLRVEARARADEGELYIGGDVDPWNTPLRLDLKLSGYNAQVVRMPEANVWISPNLTIVLAQRELRVTGTVEVPRADVLPKTLDAGVGPSADQVIVTAGDAAREPAIAVFADIGLKLGSAVRFEGFGLKTRLTGNLQLREAPGTPTSGRGEINLVDGRYKAYGQDLTIETGRLLFTGGAVTEPAVELRATRQPREDIRVGVLVRGTLAKPLLSLFSTPSMSQQQQLSWLILGRDLEEAGGSEDQKMLAGAALSMGLAGGEWLAQRFGGGLGLDQISLGAQPGQSAEQAQFTVGKYLRPGLFISYGIGLFQPGHTFKLEYDIGKGFKLATESGVESGGDVLYTIERAARVKPPTDTPASAE